jgi:predicted dinucleotide-binding enzyme
MGGAPSMNNQATFATQTPTAKVYRAFNNYGWEVFDNPTYQGIAADLFYSGPEGPERSTVEKLVSDVGLNPILLGGPDSVEAVDSVLKMWFTLAVGRKMGRTIALKVLTR